MELTLQASRIKQDLLSKSRKALASKHDPLVSGWSDADQRFHEDRIARLSDNPSPNNVTFAAIREIERAA